MGCALYALWTGILDYFLLHGGAAAAAHMYIQIDMMLTAGTHLAGWDAIDSQSSNKDGNAI